MFATLTVRARLQGGFLLIALLGAIVAGIGVYNMATMNAQAERAYSSDLMGISALKEANINMVYIGRDIRSRLLVQTDAARATADTAVEQARKDMHAQLDIARPLFHTEKGRAMFGEIDRQLAVFEDRLTRLRELSRVTTDEGRQAATAYLFNEYKKDADLFDDKLSLLSDQKEATAAASAKETAAVYSTSRAVMLAMVAGILAIGVAIGLLITRSLTRQLGGEPAYAAQVAGLIAAGDLSARVALAHGDDSSLLAAMEKMRASLVQIVSEVRSGTDTIATAASEISSGNLDLSSRTEQQASSLEETASSMEELTGTVRQNADNARQANVLAASASEVALAGGAVVAEVVHTMASINESSNKIVDIIGVIDGIAFQTNILALNAAVEAARAGEQGRGFAVVASEVRNLAQRSASAAKEIKTLIDDSVGKVEAGGKLVDKAGQTMTEIVASITRVTDIMGEIASASSEQTVGIEQVNAAIAQMDEVTQQNAALVEEAAAAAGSLQDQSSVLAQLVGTFKLDHAAPTQPRAAAAKAAAAAPVIRTAAATIKPAMAAAVKPAPAPATKRTLAAPPRTVHADGEEWEAF
jgi:methyl-accepting chemotaxis protein